MSFASRLISFLPAGLLLSVFTSTVQAGQAPQPNICTRACWLARAPGYISQMSTLNRAIIHHTADPNHFNTTGLEASKANVRGVQNYHMNTNGWSDIGYHFLVDKFGNIFEGRSGSMSTKPKGAHDGSNTNSFGFNIMGYFHPTHNQQPTGAMLDSLYDVIAWRMPSTWSPYGGGSYGSLGVTVGWLDGHRRVKATACPGDIMYNTYITTNLNGGDARNQVNARKNDPSGEANGNRKGLVRTPSGQGYWIVASDGGVFSYGNAAFYGSMGGQQLNSPVVGMAARPQGDGYWLVASDGGVFSFGAAPFRGSMAGQPLNAPMVGIAATTDGQGYWLVGQDGGIFAFNAPFHGSLGGQGYNDIVTISVSPATNGYWIMRKDGAIYSYNAPFHGGANNFGLTDFVGMAPRSNSSGYWLVRANGSVYTYGAVNYRGGANEPGLFAGMAAGPSTYDGYWLLKKDGAIYSYGDATYHGGAN